MPNDYYHCYDDLNGNAVAGQRFTRNIRDTPDQYGQVGNNVNMDFYSLTADMTQLCADADNKNLRAVNTQTLGQSAGGRELHCIVLGPNNRPKVLVCGCHHAREWISVEVPYALARYLVDTYPAANLALNAMTHEQRRVKHLVDNRQIWIAPMVNPDGHEYTLTGSRVWRKNRSDQTVNNAFTIDRHWGNDDNYVQYYAFQGMAGQHNTVGVNLFGNHQVYSRTARTLVPFPACNQVVTINQNEEDVANYSLDEGTCAGGHEVQRFTVKAVAFRGVDINRNFSVNAWGVETGRAYQIFNPRTPWVDSYCGPQAGSEAETHILEQLVTNQQFASVLTYHNCSQLILFPDAVWTGRNNNAEGRAVEIACRMSDLIYQSRQNRYAASFVSGIYPASGDLTEYAHEVHNIPRSYTVELPPLYSQRQHEWSKLPRTEIQAVVDENLPAALALINCAGHTALSAQATHGPPQNVQGNIMVQVTENCWKVFNNWPNAPNL